MAEMRNVYSILVGKSEGKRLFRRPRRRWEDNIGTYLREIVWGLWTGFIWLSIMALVNTVMNFRFP
jgi:hypothetical protein